MQFVFYVKKGKKGFVFDNNEKHHIKVLRIHLPDELYITDGVGNLYKAYIDKDFNIKEYKKIRSIENNEFINLFFGLCEKSRMKIIIEKATELGVKSLNPFFSDYSSKYFFSPERSNSIIKSAIKQSKRFITPVCNKAIELKNIDRMYFKNAYFGSIKDNNKLIDISEKEDINLFIGPPSGFSIEEEEFLLNNGVKPFHLSTAILRTETFAISFISIIHYIKGSKYG